MAETKFFRTGYYRQQCRQDADSSLNAWAGAVPLPSPTGFDGGPHGAAWGRRAPSQLRVLRASAARLSESGPRHPGGPWAQVMIRTRTLSRYCNIIQVANSLAVTVSLPGLGAGDIDSLSQAGSSAQVTPPGCGPGCCWSCRRRPRCQCPGPGLRMSSSQPESQGPAALPGRAGRGAGPGIPTA